MESPLRKCLLELLGPARCLLALEDRLPYAQDASHFHHAPDVVALPETTQEVAAILRLANELRMPVTPRGAGSGLTGGAVPCHGGVTLSLDRMDRVLEVDAPNFLAVAQPGVVTAQLNAAARPNGLFFAPDPASAAFSSLGGNIAENAGGMRAVKYGVTRHSVLGLTVVTPTGQIIHTGSKCLKDVVGYGLTELFVGSEGTLGVVCEAVCRLRPLPAARRLARAYFPDMHSAARAVLAILRQGVQPSALEFLDRHSLDAVRRFLTQDTPAGAHAMLLVEVDGGEEETRLRAEQARGLCAEHAALRVDVAHDEAGQTELWRARRSLHAAICSICGHWLEEDISVPLARIPAMLDLLEDIRRGLDLRLICFGHFGDGNIHLSYTGAAGPLSGERAREAARRMYQAAASLEGRIASEHGIGLAKAENVGWNLDPATLDIMRGMKRLLDPNGILNPGKCFPGEQSAP